MEKQILLIHNFPVLYNIFFELKDHLNFNLRQITDDEIKKKKFSSLDLIISNQSLNLNNQIIFENLPMEIGKFIDIVNLKFLKKKIEFQKDIKVGKYIINFNTRKMQRDSKFLSLTEKESLIINFLYYSKLPVSIAELQKNVWGFKSELETHTVETHVYRLRKKISSTFKDRSFINSHKNGYIISGL